MCVNDGRSRLMPKMAPGEKAFFNMLTKSVIHRTH